MLEGFFLFLFGTYLNVGQIDIILAGRTHRLTGQKAGRQLVIRLTDQAALRALVLRPDLAFGELYMERRLVLETGSLSDLLALLYENFHGWSATLPGRATLMANRLAGKLRSFNPLAKARANVAHHYDLGDDL